MAIDKSYSPKTYRRQQGDEFVVAPGGAITVQSSGAISIEDDGALNVAGDILIDATGTFTNGGTQTVENQTLTGYTAQPVALASTAANAVFEGILNVSSTNSAGTGVYLLDVPVAAGITMDAVCTVSTGGVTLATTAGTIEMNGVGGNTLTFASTTGASVHLIAVTTGFIHAIPSSTAAVTLS